MQKRYASPLRYPGGKGRMFPFFERLFLDNYLIGIAYAEPYAGGAGLALRLLFGGYVSRIFLNDLDPAIYAFWTTVLEHTEELCNWISEVPVTVDQWQRYRAIQALPASEVEPVDLAKATFFLNRTNVSGVLKGGMIGGKNQGGRYSLDARFKRRKDLIERIEVIRSYSSKISISNFDGIDFVERLDSTLENVFIYADPPYVQKGSDLYLNAYTERDHANLAERIVRLQKHWVVSYDDHTLIRRLYPNWTMVSYRIAQSTSNRVGYELFVFSNRLESASAIPLLRGAYLVTNQVSTSGPLEQSS